MNKPLIAFCILALCSLLLSINVVTIKATEPGYERIDYMPDTSVTITIDGNWTTTNEWTNNGAVTMIGTDVAFRSVWTAVSQTEVYDTFLVEFLSDNTTDTGDYWQMGVRSDRSLTATTPQATDYRVDIVNHTDLIVYQGNGTGWTKISAPASLQWADSISASPTNSTPHWILEITFLKTDLGAGPYWDLRLAAYDESTDTLAAWPPTSPDDPSRWGYQNYTTTAIPESFSLGVVVLLSSAAVAVAFYCLRKRSRTDEYGLGKLGK